MLWTCFGIRKVSLFFRFIWLMPQQNELQAIQWNSFILKTLNEKSWKTQIKHQGHFHCTIRFILLLFFKSLNRYNFYLTIKYLTFGFDDIFKERIQSKKFGTKILLGRSLCMRVIWFVFHFGWNTAEPTFISFWSFVAILLWHRKIYYLSLISEQEGQHVPKYHCVRFTNNSELNNISGFVFFQLCFSLCHFVYFATVFASSMPFSRVGRAFVLKTKLYNGRHNKLTTDETMLIWSVCSRYFPLVNASEAAYKAIQSPCIPIHVRNSFPLLFFSFCAEKVFLLCRFEKDSLQTQIPFILRVPIHLIISLSVDCIEEKSIF